MTFAIRVGELMFAHVADQQTGSPRFNYKYLHANRVWNKEHARNVTVKLHWSLVASHQSTMYV